MVKSEMKLYEARIYIEGDDFIGWTIWADDVSHAVEQFINDPAVYECDLESSRWEFRQYEGESLDEEEL